MSTRRSRKTDPVTSKLAGKAIAPHLTAIQQRVMKAFRIHGPMTRKQLVHLPHFADDEESTIRSRCPELVKMGVLEEAGEQTAKSGRKEGVLRLVKKSV